MVLPILLSARLRLALLPLLKARACAPHGLPVSGGARGAAAHKAGVCRASISSRAVCASSSSSMSEGKGKHTYPWPRPSVTVDAIVVAAPDGEGPKLLLIQRKHDPFAGAWALPGGFVDEDEPLDVAAARELQEETSVDPSSVLLSQVGAFGDPGRDPRGWCITVAYAALVPSTQLGVKAADDAQAAQWFDVTQLPRLAFDHKLVVRTAFRHLAGQQAVLQFPGLADQLRNAAEALEGPWQEQ